MITKDQIINLSETFQIDEFSIFREYLQLVFLSYLYQEKEANIIYFKGGTALRLLFGSPRFSEDLDFSTSLTDLEIARLLNKIIKKIGRELPGIKLKPLHRGKEGIRYRIIISNSEFKYPFSIRLDFHQQKKIKDTSYSIMTTKFPIQIFPQIFHLTKEGILNEKFMALNSRKKGRDIFDIWFLLSKGIVIEKIDQEVIKNIKLFPQSLLSKDLGKFLPKSQKQIIPNLKMEIVKLLKL